jgi:hypothetical protein
MIFIDVLEIFGYLIDIKKLNTFEMIMFSFLIADHQLNPFVENTVFLFFGFFSRLFRFA